MQIVDKISISELRTLASKMFGNLVKGVVDVENEILVIDADLHSDEEAFLISNGSDQKNLWGINIYPDLSDEDRIEFDSLINLRPSAGNNSRGVESEDIRNKIIKIVNSKLTN